ncbi:MAG: site-2 protease family protein, partial [Waterburya sp.]
QQLLGAIITEALKQIPTSQWNEIHLNELVTPVPEDDIILADTSLLEVAKTIETKNARELVVVSETGEVLGLLEKASIINLMTQQQQKSNRSDVSQAQDSNEILLEKKS